MAFFGEYLKRLRERANVSQESLAEEAEISSAYISQIESGRRNPPTPDVLRRMAAPLGVPYIVLMRQADHIRDEDLQALLLQAMRTLFAQDPGREQLEMLLREAVDRWTTLEPKARATILDNASAEHIGDILWEAVLDRQMTLLLAQLFSSEDEYDNDNPD